MKRPITYKRSGVDIDTADRFIDRIVPLVETTKTPGVLGGLGGFSGFFSVPWKKFDDPVLVASTDGVGTKLILAKAVGVYTTIGIDLVAMCVNDIVVTGAEPLFFLDYYATGKLSIDESCDIMKGIVDGCRQAGCALIGGETAELPGLYRKGDFDLAGFSVGIVDRKRIIDGSRVRVGDAVIGIQSSGLHSNGFSLVRKVVSKKEQSGPIGRTALTPTIIYVRPVLEMIRSVDVRSLAHITGGGFLENIPRVIPADVNVVVKRSAWRIPNIFSEIQERANLPLGEMFRTFNMGIGMVMIVPKKDAPQAKRLLQKRFGLRSYLIGSVTRGCQQVIID